MAFNPGATKRQKEAARRDKQRRKDEKKEQRKRQKAEQADRPESGCAIGDLLEACVQEAAQRWQAGGDSFDDGSSSLRIVHDETEDARQQQQRRQKSEQRAVGQTTGQESATGLVIDLKHAAERDHWAPVRRRVQDGLQAQWQPHVVAISLRGPRTAPPGDRRHGPAEARPPALGSHLDGHTGGRRA